MKQGTKRSATNLALAWASAATLAMLLGTAAPAFGQNVTISDTQFNDSDWTEQVMSNNNPTDWTYSAQQYTTGGNPDAFRGQTWEYLNNDGAAGSLFATTDLYTGQPYNPATQGGFQFVNFSMDDYIADVMGGSGSRVIGFEPAMEQNGTFYAAGYIVSSSSAWTTNSWPSAGVAYGAGAFNRYFGTGPAHPDFSANAAPITFGYYDSLNVAPSNSPYDLFHGVDNFTVQLTQSPQPTTGQYIVNTDIGYTDAAHAYNGQAGIPAPGDNWNIVSSGTTGPIGGFQDSQGNPTSVGYRWKTGPGLQLLSPVPLVSDVFDSNYTALVDDGSFNGVEGNLTPDIYGGEMYVTGLVPDGQYNLALYGIAYSALSSTTYLTKFTVNGTSQTPAGPIDNDTLGGNYIQDNNVVADANGEIRVQLHNANYLNPDTGLEEGGIYTMNGFQVQSLGVANPTWTGGSGNWSSAGSWSAGTGAPAGAGSVAEFDNAAGPTNVTLDGPQTVGTLGFNSAQKFTLSGSAVTLDGNGYDSMINVTQGSHEIAAPINVANGEAEIVLSNNASLKLSGKLTGLVSRVQLGTASTLDLTSNSMDVQYFGNDPYSEILADVNSAFDKGKWDGTGITTSLAVVPANSGALAIGVVDNAAAGWTTFEGQPVTASSVLIAPTWYGDANMDGVVNSADLDLMSAGETGGLTGWQNGDFNYDGVVNADDAALFMLGSALQKGPIGTVPEPAGALLLLAAAPLLYRRRRR